MEGQRLAVRPTSTDERSSSSREGTREIIPERFVAVWEGGRRRRRSLGGGEGGLVWVWMLGFGWVGGLQGGVEGVGHGVFLGCGCFVVVCVLSERVSILRSVGVGLCLGVEVSVRVEDGIASRALELPFRCGADQAGRSYPQ